MSSPNHATGSGLLKPGERARKRTVIGLGCVWCVRSHCQTRRSAVLSDDADHSEGEEQPEKDLRNGGERGPCGGVFVRNRHGGRARLPVGTVCTVTEPGDGSSAGVSVATGYEGNPATITAGEIAGVDVTNTYETPTTPYTPSGPDDETSTSSQSGEDLASTGASAGIGLMAVLGVGLLVGAGVFLSVGRRHRSR